MNSDVTVTADVTEDENTSLVKDIIEKQESEEQELTPEQMKKFFHFVNGKVNHIKKMERRLDKRRNKNKLAKKSRRKNRKK